MSDLARNGLRAALVAFVAGLAVAAGFGLTPMQFGVPAPPSSGFPSGYPGQSAHEHGPDEEPYMTREIQVRQLKRLREEHQRQLFNDTARLLQMANALKAEVDQGDAKESKDTLSADVIKQADEIGKLAKRVSDRIKTQ